MTTLDSNIDDETRSLIEKEIIEALSTYRTQLTLLTQIVTVIILANVSLIGIAMTSNKFSLFYLEASCPLLILFVRIKSSQLMLPIAYTAYHLEQKLGKNNIDWLATTYISTNFSGSYVLLKAINEKETHQERINELKKIST